MSNVKKTRSTDLNKSQSVMIDLYGLLFLQNERKHQITPKKNLKVILCFNIFKNILDS